MEKVEINRKGDTTLATFDLKDFNKIYAKLNRALRVYVNRDIRKECKVIFSNLWRKMDSHSKYEQSDRLIPIIVYLILKKRGLNVRVSDFLKFMKIDKKNFFESFKRVLRLYPDFQKRNRQKIVKKK